MSTGSEPLSLSPTPKSLNASLKRCASSDLLSSVGTWGGAPLDQPSATELGVRKHPLDTGTSSANSMERSVGRAIFPSEDSQSSSTTILASRPSRVPRRVSRLPVGVGSVLQGFPRAAAMIGEKGNSPSGDSINTVVEPSSTSVSPANFSVPDQRPSRCLAS